MAKGGSTESKVELPPEIKAAALNNLGMAKDVAGIPYAPNFGLQMAAFTPDQNASFANTNQAASAFGLPTAASQTKAGGPNAGQNVNGMPTPQNVGGWSGYSTKPLYENSVAQIPKATNDMIQGFQTARTNESSLKPADKNSNKNSNIKKVEEGKLPWAPRGAPQYKKNYKEGATYFFGGDRYFYKDGGLHKVTGSRKS